MPIKIKNWKLAIHSLIIITGLTSLGLWQLSRAQQKKILLESFANRSTQSPLSADKLDAKNDLRFYRANLTGSFDNQHSFLLDNKIVDSQVGYEIYTPFKLQFSHLALLVDRGFIPLGGSRATLPALEKIEGMQTVSGILNLPSTYISLGQMEDMVSEQGIQRIEFIQLEKLSAKLGYPLFPYLLTLTPNESPYPIKWQTISMGPERHIGYAVQWFALALTLLILSLVLNRA